jgi:hypothetical protein
MESKRKKFGIEMQLALHRRLKTEASARGMKLYEATEEAVKAYLGENDGENRGPRDRVPTKLQHYMEKLADILASGDGDIISGVVQNIDLFHELHGARTVRKRS